MINWLTDWLREKKAKPTGGCRSSVTDGHAVGEVEEVVVVAKATAVAELSAGA